MNSRAIACQDVGERLLGRSIPEPNTGCWLWERTRVGRGYGLMRVGGKYHPAHRLAYLAWRGPIPAGMLVCHHCDTPSCINPAHLYAGTASDNNHDTHRRKRRAPQRGERGPAAKLTASSVAVIRARLSAGERQRAIALDYGVTPGAISLIALRKTWTDESAAP